MRAILLPSIVIVIMLLTVVAIQNPTDADEVTRKTYIDVL